MSVAVASTPERPVPATRLGRAALVAFAAASTGAVACGGQTIGRGGTSDEQSGGSAGMAGSVASGGGATTGGAGGFYSQPFYGAAFPPFDAGVTPSGGAGGFFSIPPYGISIWLDSGTSLIGAGGAPPRDAGAAGPPDAGAADSGLSCIDDFAGGVPARCCPDPLPDCTGKPDGYPGYACTPPPRSFCSCNCASGKWVCWC